MDYDTLKQRLTALDTAAICDAEKALKLGIRVMDPGIQPIRSGLKLVGRAHTLTCHNDFLTVLKGLQDAAPGEVLVIDSQDSTRAVTGNLFPTEARRKGLAGIINDGPCRDTAIIRTMEFPYYARSICCVPGANDRLFATQIPVTCGGVKVEPGDIVFGDDDGVVVATRKQLEGLLATAEEVQLKERRLLEGMSRDVSLLQMLNFQEHCAALKDGKATRLEFRV